MSSKVDIDSKKIMKSFGTGPSKKTQIYLAKQVERRDEKYVPWETGALSTNVRVAGDGSSITYTQRYAVYQFYGHYKHSDPRRMRKWHRRMMATERKSLIEDVKEYAEGRPG